MDPILNFVEEQNAKISLLALLQSRNYLGEIQQRRSFLTPQDIRSSFISSSHLLTEYESNFHAALMIETCIKPSIGNDQEIRLRIEDDFISNDVLFVSSLLNTLIVKANGMMFPSIVEFKRCVNVFLGSKSDISMKHSSTVLMDHQHPNIVPSHPLNYHRKYARDVDISAVEPSYLTSRGVKLMMPILPQQLQPMIHSYNMPKKNIEQYESVIRFLAQVRKQGMDILFPQETHDKVCL